MEISISLLECCSEEYLGVPEKPRGLWAIRKMHKKACFTSRTKCYLKIPDKQ